MYRVFHDSLGNIQTIVNEDLVPEERKNEGFLIEGLPVVNTPAGKADQLYVDVANKELKVRFIDRKLTTEEEMIQLKEENKTLKANQEVMQQALDELIFGGMA